MDISIRFASDGRACPLVEKRDVNVADHATIAIIGTGPRGISVLERLAVRLCDAKPDRDVTIYAIDDVEVGCGRIWRTDQSRCLVMNNRCGEVTMFSGPTDGRAWRPGNGPAFAEWWSQVDANFPGRSTYAPRALYGKYLKFVLETIEHNLPVNVRLVRICAKVVQLEKMDERYALSLESGEGITADRIVACLGHPVPELTGNQLKLFKYSQKHTRTTYIPAGSPACMNFGSITSKDTVGVVGLGLTFYDVLASLTIGRGGRFVEGENGLRYIRSGREPQRIVAGSRRALPIPVRGSCQREYDYRHTPRFFTHERILGLRSTKRLDFRRDVFPWLMAELNYVFAMKQIPDCHIEEFSQRLACSEFTVNIVLSQISEIAAHFGVRDLIDLEAMANPFRDQAFVSQSAFRRAMIDLVTEDIRQSSLGDFHGPLKAVVEVLREARSTIRLAVDFGGLTSDSHKDFFGNIGPSLAFLATGPSGTRARQLLSLINDGLLEILGPAAQFEANGDGAYVGFSPMVESYRIGIDVLVDARVPTTELQTDSSPLVKNLLDKGMWRPYVNHGDNPCLTGGLDITEAQYHPVGRDGTKERHMHALGITTEHARWFTQVGIARLGASSSFFAEADTIAVAISSAAYRNGKMAHCEVLPEGSHEHRNNQLPERELFLQ